MTCYPVYKIEVGRSRILWWFDVAPPMPDGSPSLNLREGHDGYAVPEAQS